MGRERRIEREKENMDTLILHWTSVKAIMLSENAEICVPREDKEIAEGTESRGGT